MIFKELLTQSEIAEQEGYSLSYVRQIAMDPKFPEAARSIGLMKFYAAAAVRDYFRNRVDHRKFNGRKLRR